MPIWATAPITREPEVRLSNWQIVEIDAGTWHFVGFNIRLREGRVSSAIVTFDPEARTGVTRSGRVYKLEGEPGTDPDADWTWAGWKWRNSVKSHKVVTEQALTGG